MERDRPRFRGLWWKLPLAGLALLLLLAFVAHTIWTGRERAGMLREVAKIRALGEPIDVADLTEPTFPDAQNRAVAIRAAIAAYVEPDERKEQREQIESDDPNAFTLPLTDAEESLLREHVADNAAALKHMDGLAAMVGTAWNDPPTPGTPRLFATLADTNGPRTLANLARDAALLASIDDDSAAAIGHVHAMNAIAEAASRRQDLMHALIATGIGGMAASTVTEMAPQMTPGAADARQLISALLDDAAIAGQWRIGLLGERVSSHELFARYADGTFPFSAASGTGTPAPTFRQRVVAWAFGPFIYMNDRALLAYYGESISLLEAPDLAAHRARVGTLLAMESEADASKRLFLARTLMPTLGRAAEARYRLLTDRHLAAAALAVRLYAIDHDGALPSSLEALVPVYLPAVPLDAIDGQPLRYDPARVILWSVGADGSDNGGDETLERPEQGRYRWQMRDAVVHLTPQPRPATQPSE